MNNNARDKIGAVAGVSEEPDAETLKCLAYSDLSATKALKFTHEKNTNDLCRRLDLSEKNRLKLQDDLQIINKQARKGEAYLAILTKSKVQTMFGTVCAMVGAALIADDSFKIGWTISLFAIIIVVFDQIGTRLFLRPTRT